MSREEDRARRSEAAKKGAETKKAKKEAQEGARAKRSEAGKKSHEKRAANKAARDQQNRESGL